MTDAANIDIPDQPYRSEIDPLFSAAWNEVFNPEDPDKAAEGTGAAGATGASKEKPAAGDQGADADKAAAGAPPAGTLPNAADLAAADGNKGGAGQAPAGGQAPATRDTLVDGVALTDADRESGIGDLDVTEVTPLFATASQSTVTNMETAFRNQALQEFQKEIDPQFVAALRAHPFNLVGSEVPDIRPNAKPEDRVKILDVQMGRDWQEAVAQQIESEIQDKVKEKTDEIRPTMSIIQDSFLLFQNNPDLVIGTKQFDPELAARFVDLAKTYEFKLNEKTVGYTVNVQPLINATRSQLEKERGANGARTEDRAAQQRAAAAQQQRNAAGQFDSPQAGIPSTAGRSSQSDDEDMSTFWTSVGMGNISL